MAAEIKPREAQIEAIRVDPSEEIVALMAVARKVKDGNGQLTAQDMPTIGAKVHVCKSGEPDFYLRNNQFAKIKRAVADWHVAKHNVGAIDHVLDLKILSLDEIEALKKGGKREAEVSERSKMIAKLIELKVIGNVDEAAGVEDDELAELIESNPAKETTVAAPDPAPNANGGTPQE